MKSAIVLISCALPAMCQQQINPKIGPAPIFQVTVVERTVKAVNYQYRSDPTMIDFRGTVLLPKAKGDAVVQSKRGRTEIDVRFDNLAEPQRFGLEYLTYVLWALTPDGRPHNLGEVVPGPSDKANLRVTTDMQAFAMIVTVEPYSAVRQPSDVVVLENVVRPDTEGKIETVNAKYELLPRGSYALQIPAPVDASVNNGPKVSMHEYEAISELYQAQNAVGYARVAGADRYAPDTFAKARQLFYQAQQLQNGQAESSRVIETAREAAETAEDARVIAEKRKQDEKVAKAQAEAAYAQRAVHQAVLRAQSDVENAQAETQAAQAEADEERAARRQAEAEAAAAIDQAAQARAQVRAQRVQPANLVPKIAVRSRLLQQLNGCLPTLDTPRGLVATIADAGYTGAMLTERSSDQVAHLAATVAARPDLRIEVEGYTSHPDATGLSQRRAEAARQALIASGAPAGMVVAVGFGNSRPVGPSGTAANQRVEVLISGNSIGNVPVWDRTYSLLRR